MDKIREGIAQITHDDYYDCAEDWDDQDEAVRNSFRNLADTITAFLDENNVRLVELEKSGKFITRRLIE